MYLDIIDFTNFYFLDLECDGLTPTVIHCVVIKNKATQQVWKFTSDQKDYISHLKEFIEQRLAEQAIFCAHNGISFDSVVLANLAGVHIPISQMVDSLVLSFLYNPVLVGGHSLEAYGERLKFPKVEHTDWSVFTPEMLNRCVQDVELLELTYNALTTKMRKVGFSELSCEIEHSTRELVDRQQRHGFYFDKAGAESLRDKLRQRESDLAVPIQKLFPPKLEEMGRYKRRHRADGSDYASYTKHIQTYPVVKDNEDGSYSCFSYSDFNIGSPAQRLDRLLELGYVPTAKTKKGNPRIDEESLLLYTKESGRPEVGMMAEWLVCNGRANMIQTWLDNLGSDSRIHGRVMTCGATTRRMSHNGPNTANIPSPAKAAYGHECRSMWLVEPLRGLKLVGVDASGLENVGMLHYLNNKKAEEILTKSKPDDVHSLNARELTEALGRSIDREWGAKTSYFAWLFGAYPPKLGEIVKGPPSDGEIIIKTFFKNVPGLANLIKEVQSEWKRNGGLLRTIDGGYVRCPSINAALNYRIQSLGAIVMKLAAIILDRLAQAGGLNFHTVATVHDEWQMEVEESKADQLGQLAVFAIEEAARQLQFKVKLTGSYKIGDTWAMTH